eukprot:NODE_159_length_15043_cov_0.440444.p3 type:complete len:646 gc:universal NODE_159_length_15043_cov_0.440444:6547-8484(+)
MVFISNLVFDFTDDEFSMRCLFDGISDFCQVAHNSDFSEPIDALVICLCCMTGLYQGYNINSLQDLFDIKVNENEQPFFTKTNPVSVEFGSYFKGQIALHQLCKIVQEYSRHLSHSWYHFCNLLKKVFNAQLLHPNLTTVIDFVGIETSLYSFFPKVEEKSESQQSSIFSTLSSYFAISANASPMDSNAVPTLQQEKFMNRTLECLQESKILYVIESLDALEASDLVVSLLKSSAEILSIDDPEHVVPFSALAFKVIITILEHSEAVEMKVLQPLSRFCKRLGYGSLSCKKLLLWVGSRLIKCPNQAVQDIALHAFSSIISDSDFSKKHFLTLLTGFKLVLCARLLDSQWFLDFFKQLPELANLSSNAHLKALQEIIFKTVPFTKSSIISNSDIISITERILYAMMESNISENSKICGQMLDLLYHSAVNCIENENQIQLMWDSTALNVIDCLSKCIYCHDSDVRQKSFFYLQRLVNIENLNDENAEFWSDKIFYKSLFPFFKFENVDDEDLLDELRMRATAILTKIYLNFFNQITNWNQMESILIDIVKVMRSFYQTSSSTMIEIIPEALKNIILVMVDASKLDESEEICPNIWIELEFLPNLKSEIFKPEKSSASQYNSNENLRNEEPEKENPDMDPSRPVMI